MPVTRGFANGKETSRTESPASHDADEDAAHPADEHRSGGVFDRTRFADGFRRLLQAAARRVHGSPATGHGAAQGGAQSIARGQPAELFAALRVQRSLAHRVAR